MKKFNLITVSIAMFFMVNLSFSQKSITLKYNLQENDQYNYITETDQSISMETDGVPMIIEMKLYMEMLYKILDKTSERNTIEGQINRVKMTQSIFGMNINYDSNDSTADPMLAKMDEEFQKILKKPFDMTMDHEGKINNLDLSNIGDNNDLASNFNSGTSFAVFPKNSIKIGESWNADIEPAAKSDMRYTVKYTLVKIENNEATISIEAVISANQVEEVSLNLEGTMNGEMIVDTKSGWLIESLLTQNLKMDLEQEDITIPATSTGTIKTTSTKI